MPLLKKLLPVTVLLPVVRSVWPDAFVALVPFTRMTAPFSKTIAPLPPTVTFAALNSSWLFALLFVIVPLFSKLSRAQSAPAGIRSDSVEGGHCS